MTNPPTIFILADFPYKAANLPMFFCQNVLGSNIIYNPPSFPPPKFCASYIAILYKVSDTYVSLNDSITLHVPVNHSTFLEAFGVPGMRSKVLMRGQRGSEEIMLTIAIEFAMLQLSYTH